MGCEDLLAKGFMWLTGHAGDLLLKLFSWWQKLWDDEDSTVEIRVYAFAVVVGFAVYWLNIDVHKHTGFTTQSATVICGLFTLVAVNDIGKNFGKNRHNDPGDSAP